MKNKLNERTFISKNWILYFYLFLGFSCQSNQSLYKDRPNIILLLADDLGYSLQQIAEMNIYKLQCRMNKGTIVGDGDDR